MDDEPRQLTFADLKLGVHTVDILPGQLAMLEGGSMCCSNLSRSRSGQASLIAQVARLPTAAAGADRLLTPTGHGRFGTLPLGHLGRIGLDLVLALLAPRNEPDTGGGAVAEHQRWVGVHRSLTGQ